MVGGTVRPQGWIGPLAVPTTARAYAWAMAGMATSLVRGRTWALAAVTAGTMPLLLGYFAGSSAHQFVSALLLFGGLYQLLTVREHLWLVADLHELPVATSRRRIDEITAQMELGSFIDRRIDTLSKGQRQRVAIACGLVHEPKVLLLDEPLSGLDVHGVLAFRDRIREIAAAGGAVLYSSHVLDVVERMCGRALIIDRGAIVADAPTAELAARGADGHLESLFRELTRADREVQSALQGGP